MSKEQVEAIQVVNDKEIKGFFGDYRFLSNFHQASFIDKRAVVWETTEHFYQAMKSEDESVQEEVRLAPLNKVRKLGKNLVLRPGWEAGLKDEIMLEALVFKFTQNPELKALLLATGEKYLEETNWWGDKYFGRYNGEGKNILGKLLMSLREILREYDG